MERQIWVAHTHYKSTIPDVVKWTFLVTFLMTTSHRSRGLKALTANEQTHGDLWFSESLSLLSQLLFCNCNCKLCRWICLAWPEIDFFDFYLVNSGWIKMQKFSTAKLCMVANVRFFYLYIHVFAPLFPLGVSCCSPHVNLEIQSALQQSNFGRRGSCNFDEYTCFIRLQHSILAAVFTQTQPVFLQKHRCHSRFCRVSSSDKITHFSSEVIWVEPEKKTEMLCRKIWCCAPCFAEKIFPKWLWIDTQKPDCMVQRTPAGTTGVNTLSSWRQIHLNDDRKGRFFISENITQWEAFEPKPEHSAWRQ